MTPHHFYRPTYLEISLPAILSNIRELEDKFTQPTAVIPVVKANAYGHGAVEVTKYLEANGYSMFAVATPDEAVELRVAGVQAEILVLGASPHRFVAYAAAHNIHLTAFSLEWLSGLAKDAHVKLHLKLDTGMGRLGLQYEEEVLEARKLFEQTPAWSLEGIYTHFSTADEDRNTHFDHQMEKFTAYIKLFPTKPKWIHASNSAASIQHPDAKFSAVRFGISMYGLAASPWMKDSTQFTYQPAMRLVTEIVQVKKVPKGTKIGYGAIYTSEEEEWIGTLPIGYADGFLRGLRHLELVVENTRVPIAGKICMDQTMIRLPREFKVGTKVVLLGSNGKQAIPAEEWAEHLHTIPYEICCQLSSRVPRVYPQSDK